MQIMPLFQMVLLRLLLFCLLFHWAILEILLEVYQEQIIHLLERYTIKLFTKFINTMHNDRKSRKQVWTITENNCIFICPLQLCLSLFLSLVFVMLVNLLIAMMGDTYTRIAEIKNEWMRQVKLYT